MAILLNQHRALGETGLAIPPIVFGTAALGNVGRVMAEQSKLAICGAWFQHVASPLAVEVSYEHGGGMALEVLGRMLRRLAICNDEIIVQLSIGRSDFDGLRAYWDKSRRLLGEDYRPKLISVVGASEEPLRAAWELRDAGLVHGVGLEVDDSSEFDLAVAADTDWVALRGGLTIMRHPPKVLELMTRLARREIPVIASGIFERGFLVGRSRLDGRVVNAENAPDRSLLAWRKAFVALCDGHGVSPAHACVQFVLSASGVAAVVLESSYADRVAENVAAVSRNVPTNFWQSMKEEGLLSEDYPIGGL